MNNTELCSDCKKVEVLKSDDNNCSECAQYLNKYYCDTCKIKHSCNKGFWESINDKKAPRLEKLIRKFVQDVILEVENIMKESARKNLELRS
jgi:CTP:phosphocholine cytidylyltransferase-like protein